MSLMLNNTKPIPTSGSKIYVCQTCFRTFNSSQGYAGHFKAHRHGRVEPYRRKKPSKAPYPPPVPLSARVPMTNNGQGAREDIVYAPIPLSVYNPYTKTYVCNYHVAEKYLHDQSYVTKDFIGVNSPVGSSERTISDKNIEDITKVGTEVTSLKDMVEEELDLELRL